ncbi:MAG: cyclic nucleotide-binding domain-containing protein, partial [Proteobacteria bacterium]|nr:cyclic nucleotide-binding domain-containing protein [Pseudomonadota bacterium]
MSIEDDVALLERIPTLRLLGNAALRVLAISSEQQQFARGSILFRAGDESDGGFVVQDGAFRVHSEDGNQEVVAERGALMGELALIVAMPRPATATALEYSTVIRISRTLFQRVLDSDPAAARRL